jgi:hypothetical protein
MGTSIWRLMAAASTALVAAVPARAQPQATPSSDAPRWEIEAYGGVSLGRLSSGGTMTLPPPGAPIPTSSPIFPSWRVPTWFLGDGAAFLNQVADEFGLSGRIVPLDSALEPPTNSDAGTILFGARVRHPLTRRYSVEGGVEISGTALDLPDEVLEAANAAGASFQTTFRDLFSTGPFTGTTVSATGSPSTGSSREVAITGALVADLASWGGFVPYALAGGGWLTHVGDPPSLGLEGTYRTRIEVGPLIEETDRLTVRYGQRSVFVGMFGGGFRHEFSARLGLRIDARVLLGPSTTRVALEADPRVTTSTPASFIETFTHPNLQFSNNPSTGRESTLSGRLDGFDAFDGGWQTRIRLTAGVVWKY